MNIRSLQFVAGLHGDEPAPLIALAASGERVIAGNPRALFAGRRYIERDLNASFGLDGTTYEESRARELLGLLDPKIPTIDFHTFSCESQAFAVVVDERMIELAKCTGVEHVVVMRHNIKEGHSLCDLRPCVSVEVGQHENQESMITTIEVLESLASAHLSRKVDIYEVFGIITEAGEYRNFEECAGGFIPILAGERAYPHFGLKARRIG